MEIPDFFHQISMFFPVFGKIGVIASLQPSFLILEMLNGIFDQFVNETTDDIFCFSLQHGFMQRIANINQSPVLFINMGVIDA